MKFFTVTNGSKRPNNCATNVSYMDSILGMRNNRNPLADCSQSVAQNGHRHVVSSTSQIYTAVTGNGAQEQEKNINVPANGRSRKEEDIKKWVRTEQGQTEQQRVTGIYILCFYLLTYHNIR